MNGKNLNEALVSVQSKLKAPKGQYNSFGKYKYRSCEDILEAVKPLLAEVGCTLRISDEIMQVGERIYVKATAVFSNGDAQYAVTALAREAETKPGMDAAQITGAASSYARKYALNGLFCIDDTKDPDAMNDHGRGKPQVKANSNPQPKGEGCDWTKLTALKERYAAATGMTVEEAGKSIAHTYGITRDMPAAKFAAVCAAIETNIRSLEGQNG